MTLTEALKQKGLTQRELARRAGISEPAVSVGVRTGVFRLSEAERIANVLDGAMETHQLVSLAEARAMKAWARRYMKEGGK
jgi:transcriptional regulator with XRE-family HTH domain